MLVYHRTYHSEAILSEGFRATATTDSATRGRLPLGQRQLVYVFVAEDSDGASVELVRWGSSPVAT
jgi:hypothetical protein